MLNERDAMEAGVTLIEMLAVVSLMAVFVGISFSSAQAGLSSLRLRSAASEADAFLASAIDDAQMKQEPIDVRVESGGHAIAALNIANGHIRTLHLPDGVRVNSGSEGHVVIYPGGGNPHIRLELISDRGAHQVVTP